MADGGVVIELGAFEQEALVDGFSISAVAGLNATLNRLSKWLVAAVFGIIFLWRHDAEAIWAASGSILNVGLSTILKRILNQERHVSMIRSDPGMPSSHAQSIFYTVMFCIVSSNILSQLDEENMLGRMQMASREVLTHVIDCRTKVLGQLLDVAENCSTITGSLENIPVVEYFGLNGITVVISALIFAIDSYLSWLQVSQQLHTTSQLVVGAALGFSVF